MESTIRDGKEIYQKSENYWSAINSTVNGMLGGFEKLHGPDVEDSRKLLTNLRSKKLFSQMDRALDCGAGIGRVTKYTLMPYFKTVDMVDVIESFIENSKKYLGSDDERVGNKFICGLQDFVPNEKYYDCIWVQWVTGYLTDEDFIKFFQRCKDGLRDGGCIIVKDNLASGSGVDFDEEDSSWTRPKEYMEKLLTDAGLTIIENKKQLNFPKGMYEVRMFVLKPTKSLTQSTS
ncbi:Alpha N-terminal protein methyltransferase 1 [Strongyloides ratti]|uniref:Alpha N-terminal protein methyltransferase 1 n=1 Tax=Strongyloides ratti TaxID=34506 RepID=A0A090LGX4_STRRB|nr:Alpha N-terminal protein methyltransferase 1 [Strongyloides ratti]CEF69051.1 Alpha N-terminal protein methyltransferase 1 [Strongyloides ratti]